MNSLLCGGKIIDRNYSTDEILNHKKSLRVARQREESRKGDERKKKIFDRREAAARKISPDFIQEIFLLVPAVDVHPVRSRPLTCALSLFPSRVSEPLAGNISHKFHLKVKHSGYLSGSKD